MLRADFSIKFLDTVTYIRAIEQDQTGSDQVI